MQDGEALRALIPGWVVEGGPQYGFNCADSSACNHDVIQGNPGGTIQADHGDTGQAGKSVTGVGERHSQIRVASVVGFDDLDLVNSGVEVP